MTPSDTVSPPAPCPFMAALVDLLGEMPAEPGRGRADAFTERLDGLEGDARLGGAPTATMAAIRGARVLLELAGLPRPAAPTEAP